MVFTDIIKRGTLPEEGSIHTAEMTAIIETLKEIHKRKEKKISMKSNSYNKENHPIINQIYYILVELLAQDKIITLCKLPAYKKIKEKEAIDVSGVTTTRLPHTDYNLIIRRARNSKWQREWENSNSKLHYIIIKH